MVDSSLIRSSLVDDTQIAYSKCRGENTHMSRRVDCLGRVRTAVARVLRPALARADGRTKVLRYKMHARARLVVLCFLIAMFFIAAPPSRAADADRAAKLKTAFP